MTTNGHPDLESRLRTHGHRFDFFAAVQLLRRLALEAADAPAAREALAGRAPSPRTVRFRSHASLAFPAAAIDEITTADAREGTPMEMTVTFAGLTGPAGVLPPHYTVHLLATLREKIATLRDFLDLFNHQVVSHFYEAWEKYRFVPAHECARLSGSDGVDLFTHCVACLTGMGTDGLGQRQSIEDQVALFYGGFFARRARPASALQAMLEDFLDVPVAIVQFHGRWLPVRHQDQTRLAVVEGANRGLGRDVLLGSRVWDVQSKFRARLGPMDYEHFCRFMPCGEGLLALAELVRLYVGAELEFDVEPLLRRDEVPVCRLGGSDPEPGRLGWNTWIRSREFPRDVASARFQLTNA